MNVLILDVAAESGGAVTILKAFIRRYKQNPSNTYFICVSRLDLENEGNINILKFPWVKKSWLHRLLFDYVYARKLIKDYHIDEVLSLQNNLLNIKNIPQDMYLQLSLPFVEKKYKFWENTKLWIYQNIIAIIIFKSLKKARHITVQTQWMRDAVVQKCHINTEKIIIEQPELECVTYKGKANSVITDKFFYPASPFSYKNHILIFKAVEKLVQAGIVTFQVSLTLSEDNLPQNCKKLYYKHRNQFVLLGEMKHEEVLSTYCKSILIFPSFIETLGLPLLEAKIIGTTILASDCAFSREILENYPKAYFFNPFNEQQLYELIKSTINRAR